MNSSFYEDSRYCPSCNAYVLYLQALSDAYCVECGGRVALYSKEDLKRILLSSPKGALDRDPGPLSDAPLGASTSRWAWRTEVLGLT